MTMTDSPYFKEAIRKITEKRRAQFNEALAAAMRENGKVRVVVFLAGMPSGKFKVAWLADLLSVSPSTVRKALKMVRTVKLGNGWHIVLQKGGMGS